MTKRDEILALAKTQEGITENPRGSNKVKYNTAYYGRAVSGSEYPWCCTYQWWLFHQRGADEYFYGGKKTASCSTLMNYYKSKGQTMKKPIVGAFAFYGWGSKTTAYHIGLVTAVNGDNFTANEGNTAIGNDNNGGAVMSRERNIKDVICFADPFHIIPAKKFKLTLPELKIGDTGETVRALQILLNGRGFDCGTADGEYGVKTAAAVKSFQQKNKLVVDGIAGAKTFAALLG